MKTISYRGGIVQFNIPENWVEKYDKNGGSEFYFDSQDSGTLRLNVTTLKKPKHIDISELSLVDFLKDFNSEIDPNIRQINEKVAITQYDESFVEQGQNLIIRFWIVANLVPPKNIRIATFSYTLLESQFNEPEFIEELKMLNKEIENCIFSEEIGVLKNRPWWRFGI